MRQYLVLGLTVLILAACASSPHVSSERDLSLQVAGFVQAEGITWLGWPNRVQGALEGFPGITGVAFDVEAERFDLSYDAERTNRDAIAAVIRELGYEPTTVSSTHGDVAERDVILVSDLPQEFRTLFEEAHRAEKPVLLDFTAPG